MAVARKVELPSKDLPKIVLEMKKLAQLIQLQFAKNDTENAIRSLKLFYGLLSMIRPLVVETLQMETKKRPRQKISNLH